MIVDPKRRIDFRDLESGGWLAGQCWIELNGVPLKDIQVVDFNKRRM